MRLGPLEVGLILVIIMIVFGVGKLPEVGKQLGKGLRDFKRYSAGAEDNESKTPADKPVDAKTELEITKAKLEAAEAKLKTLETSNK
jgi:sec-independent protein translocase protein TatA